MALAVVVSLAVAVFAVETLRRPAPETDPASSEVEGLPPLAIEELLSCERIQGGTDEDAEEAVRQLLGAGRVTATQVYECPDAFDGRQVTYAGEVIGGLLRRGDGAWTLVNDDPYALEVGPLPAHRRMRGTNVGLSVWLPQELTRPLTGFGEAGRRGDVVLIEGVIRRADPTDGGGLTLRAATLSILAPSAPISTATHVPQAVVAAVLAVAAAGALLYQRYRTARR